ncbi:MAG: glycosyltransferase [Actinomycetales bacterium]|nr:glycosyltransferase [Actinomycetales bacterium]
MTPVRNGGTLLADTMRSVLNQVDSDVELVYRIQDGASTDDTVRIAEQTANGRATIVSAPDTGMYDALATAFSDLDADWYCYLNAGDLWDPRCLSILRAAHEQTSARWLCGLHAYYAADGSLVHTRLPPRFTRTLLRAGAYGRGLPTVQQESTFWSAKLHHLADLEALRSYRLAGDTYLWWSFAREAEPTVIQAVLGGFRYHGGHLGVDREAYRAEVARFAGPMSVSTRARIPVELALWEQPARIKARTNPHLYLHDTTTGGWTARAGSISRPIAAPS